MKIYEPGFLDDAPSTFKTKDFRSKDVLNHKLTIQVAPDDCTGCGVCVDVCPAKSKTETRRKAINMEPVAPNLEKERAGWDFFLDIPEIDRDPVAHSSIKGSQVLEPLFEFSGACAGCGETPYIKLVTQLFGDRVVVANATGCSSIYGANLPTTPWTVNREGRGPAWSNSLFEDNAEFGLGMRLGMEAQRDQARLLLGHLASEVGEGLSSSILDAPQESEAQIRDQRERVAQLKALLQDRDNSTARHLLGLADELVRKGVWIIGGDGWAYDIGFGGLDHVLSTGRNVNVLVLDTEVYSNTGGQASKSTPRGRGCQIRLVRQRLEQEGSRRDRTRLRQRLRGPDLNGGKRRADDQGVARGRCVAGSLAGDRLLDLYRPRHRHVQIHVPSKGCGARVVTGRCTVSSRARRRANRSSLTRGSRRSA